MSDYLVRTIQPEDRPLVDQIIVKRWGETRIVSRGRIHDVRYLSGFIAVDFESIIGVLTFEIESNSCEIVTLDSLRENIGVATALLHAIEEYCMNSNLRKLWLITTNNNLRAIEFYKNRGFSLIATHKNALKATRKIKPFIPKFDEGGVPIRDELEFAKFIFDD